MLRNYREKEKYLQYAIEGFFAYLLLFRTFFFFLKKELLKHSHFKTWPR